MNTEERIERRESYLAAHEWRPSPALIEIMERGGHMLPADPEEQGTVLTPEHITRALDAMEEAHQRELDARAEELVPPAFMRDGDPRRFYCGHCQARFRTAWEAERHLAECPQAQRDIGKSFEALCGKPVGADALADAMALNEELVISQGDLAKRSNPKDAVGSGKVPFSVVPAQVTAEVGLALLEGARKYGRHNYRAIGVRASIYYDACLRHLAAWWEGQDTDPDSGLHHVVKALACLYVIRDAMWQGKCADDRPPALTDPSWVGRLNEHAKGLVERYPNAPEPYTQENTR